MKKLATFCLSALFAWLVSLAVPGLLGAKVTFRLGEVTGAPGEANVSLPVSIVVEPGAPPVCSYSFIVHYDPALLRSISFESTREVAALNYYDQAQFPCPGNVGAQVFVTFDADSPLAITSETSGVVGNLHFCILETAAPGSYPITFVPPAAAGKGLQTLYATPDTRANINIAPLPVTEAGTLIVAGEPVPGGGCQPDSHAGCASDPDRPRSSVTYSLPDGAVAPGDPFTLPFTIRGEDAEVAGFSLSLDFDEETIEASQIEKLWVRPDGKDWDFQYLYFDNVNETPGNTPVSEGIIVAAAVFSYTVPVALPANRDNAVLAFHFVAKPEAPVGTTAVRFLDGARGRGQPVSNAVSVSGSPVLPNYSSSFVLVDARLGVVDDITIFVRGDSNGDDVVNISDAQATLSYLFLGGRQPHCFDAADANDDGKLDVSDPVATLQFLFLGGPSLPEPNGTKGKDPTPDSMDCLHRNL